MKIGGSPSQATRKRVLRSGTTLWQARRSRKPAGALLSRDLRADVLVVGAGISGAMVADALSEAGLKVIIVDRRKPVSGSTPASTALLQYEIDQPLTLLAQQIGMQSAQRVWRRSRLALYALAERSAHLGIRADLIARASLYLDGDVLDRESLEAEFEARRTAGFEATLLGRATVKSRFGIAGRSAILGYGNFSADPIRLAVGFLSAALTQGAQLYSPAEIISVEADSTGVRAATAQGPVISCQHLVFATGYELAKGIPQHGHSIASTWAMATGPQPAKLWPEEVMIWEASDPYLYLRSGPQGRIICGGEDEGFADETKRDAMTPEKIAAIEKKLAKLLPGVDSRAEFSWTGNFGASNTGMPTIGRIPRMPNCHAMMGFGGNGITFSMLGAQILRTTLLGKTDPDAELFSFSRET